MMMAAQPNWRPVLSMMSRIFIPIKNHFEQEDNAKDEGFSYQDLDRLDELISQKLNEKRNPQNFEGAKKAADIIKNLIMNEY